MIVRLPFLFVALLLLWFPRQWMRLGMSMSRRRSKGSSGSQRTEEPWNRRESGDPSVSFRREFAKLRNYVDLFRAVAGGLSVMGGLGISPCLALSENPAPAAGLELLILKLGILLVGLIAQTVRNEKNRAQIFAPIFFLGGLSVGLDGPDVALFAFALIWALNPMIGNAEGFLFVYALLLLGFGLQFQGFGNKLPIVAFVYCLLPVLISWVSHRPLVLFTRKGTRSHGA